MMLLYLWCAFTVGTLLTAAVLTFLAGAHMEDEQ